MKKSFVVLALTAATASAAIYSSGLLTADSSSPGVKHIDAEASNYSNVHSNQVSDSGYLNQFPVQEPEPLLRSDTISNDEQSDVDQHMPGLTHSETVTVVSEEPVQVDASAEPADDSAQERENANQRVVDISITGNQITLSYASDTDTSQTVTTYPEHDTGIRPSSTAYDQNTPEVTNYQQDLVYNDNQTQALVQTKFDCPEYVYMGGNAYASNVLKSNGCPKPANWQGAW